jgi:YfiH family protein
MLQWRVFSASLGFPGAVHSRQVHGRTILIHRSAPDGVSLTAEADGHVTGEPGVLMGITVADCVPVFMVDGFRRVPALLHAGWRGVAAGILEAGVQLMRTSFSSDGGDLHIHLGPSICGRCYEVGPEVHRALGLPEPRGRTPVDLRRILAQKCFALGIPPQQVTLSSFCTLCDDSPFFSHRGGDPERQAGLMGIRG